VCVCGGLYGSAGEKLTVRLLFFPHILDIFPQGKAGKIMRYPALQMSPQRQRNVCLQKFAVYVF